MSDDGPDPNTFHLDHAEPQAEGASHPLDEMWSASFNEINDIDPQTENWKIQTLPLARVKKIMKTEEIVLNEQERERAQREGRADQRAPFKFMISADAPLVMSKACELLIREMTLRAWQHTERNRRRTVQRQDIHAAVGESEVFDFLVDIVPRAPTHTPRYCGMTPPPEVLASMQMGIPGMPSVQQQAQAFAPIPLSQPPQHDFHPVHGQFPYFHPLSAAGIEVADATPMGVAAGVPVPGHHHVQAHHAQATYHAPSPVHPQEQQLIHPHHNHPQQQQEQQPYQQQQQQNDQQEQSLLRWTDPPV